MLELVPLQLLPCSQLLQRNIISSISYGAQPNYFFLWRCVC
jgi:hypothetical protein